METNNELDKLNVRVTKDEGDKIGEIRMLDVLDNDGTLLGKQAGIVLEPKIANDINKYPDLVDTMRNITNDIHMVIFDLVSRENATEDDE